MMPERTIPSGILECIIELIYMLFYLKYWSCTPVCQLSHKFRAKNFPETLNHRAEFFEMCGSKLNISN